MDQEMRKKWNNWKIKLAEAAIENLEKTPLRDRMLGDLLIGVDINEEEETEDEESDSSETA